MEGALVSSFTTVLSYSFHLFVLNTSQHRNFHDRSSHSFSQISNIYSESIPTPNSIPFHPYSTDIRFPFLFPSLSLNTILIPQPKITTLRIQARVQRPQARKADARLAGHEIAVIARDDRVVRLTGRDGTGVDLL
jgi:hypothetical protein